MVVGIACSYHAKFKHMCVQDFAGGFIERPDIAPLELYPTHSPGDGMFIPLHGIETSMID